jgi:glycosidase
MSRVALAALLAFFVSCGTVAPSTPLWSHEWARGAVFYEIFVRSFADSDGDGVGDFNGMTAKLDYLRDLGIEGIWLMPVFESASYHGYDTTDYDHIERDYGTDADFRRFVDEAHKRGIRVIVDLVLNHTGDAHPWFVDSAKRDWYIWRATNPGWKQPWDGDDPSWHLRDGQYFYGAFWSGMPDLNYRNAAVKAEMFRVARHWLLEGADGYRLDATRYLVEDGPGAIGQADTAGTHAVLRELANEVRRIRPDAVLVAENTVDVARMATYFAEMPMNFNFTLASAILESVRSNDATRIRDTLREEQRLYPRGIIDAPFLRNHDHTRIATEYANDAGKLRTAAAILLTLPGMPFVYYGEELGMQNGPTSADEWKRTPMPWTAAGGFSTATPWHPYAPGVDAQNVASQTNDPASLLSRYRDWIAARKASRALRKGELALLDTPPQLLAFVRASSGERVLVVHNLGDTPIVAPALPAASKLLIGDEGVTTPTAPIPPHASAVWRLR